jgi:DNA-binding PadR family transcriptional regulator
VLLSKVELIVLGLLADDPSYGYQLLERFRQRSMGLWVEIGRASVYQALNRLEAKGLVAGRAQDGSSGPGRRIYRLTRAGRSRLEQGLAERFGNPTPYETEAGTALGFIDAVPRSERRTAAEARQRAVADLVETVRAERARQPDAHADALLARQESLALAELEWLKRYRAKLIR